MYPLANIHYRVKYVVFGPNLSMYILTITTSMYSISTIAFISKLY